MAPKPSTIMASSQPVPPSDTSTTSALQHLLKYSWVFIIGLLIRTYIIISTSNIDRYLPMKYTDIDYLVFSDASALLHQGFSPYDRATYRYSPLLAYFLLPNATLHEQYGKHVFAVCDIIVAVLIFTLLLQMSKNAHLPFKVTPKQALFMSLFYIFNPLSINLSTRGSMDVLHIAILYVFLIFFYNQWWVTAGFFYGLAVHIRIYPFIFALPIFFTFWMWRKHGLNGFESTANDQDTGENDEDDEQIGDGEKKRAKKGNKSEKRRENSTFGSKLRQFARDFIATLSHPITLKFVLTCVAVNVALIAIFYLKFGYTFLYESYIYHLVRKDTRHSFSPFFLMLYLATDAVQSFKNSFPQLVQFAISPPVPIDAESPTALTQLVHFFTEFQFQQHFSLFMLMQKILSIIWALLSSSITFIFLGALPLIPLISQSTSSHQLVTPNTTSLSAEKSSKSPSQSELTTSTKPAIFPLPIIILLLSIFFVSKNSVITAQYFLWFVAFVPLYLPYIFCEPTSSTTNPTDHSVQLNEKKQKEHSQEVDNNASPSILDQIYSYTPKHTFIQLIKVLLSCLFWLVSELLWLATAFFLEVRGIGGISWVLMNAVSIWLYLVHIWIFCTILAHVLGQKSLSAVLCRSSTALSTQRPQDSAAMSDSDEESEDTIEQQPKEKKAQTGRGKLPVPRKGDESDNIIVSRRARGPRSDVDQVDRSKKTTSAPKSTKTGKSATRRSISRRTHQDSSSD